MIYFRCEQCAGTVRADQAQANQVVPCPHCARPLVCPSETTARSPFTPSRSRLDAPPSTGPVPDAPSAATTSVSLVRIGGAVLLLSCLAWATSNVFQSAASTPPAARAETPRSAADQRQAEILAVAVDHAPDPALVRVYDEINTRHFNRVLPAIPVVWEPRLAEVGPLAAKTFTLEGMFGHIGDKAVILLNPSLARDADALRRALSHEMVHAFLHTIGDPSSDHGPAFQATLKRLADEGAFPGIVASAAERESLRGWLATESARLDHERDVARRDGEVLAHEAQEIEQALAELNARTRASAVADDPAVADWTRRRDAYNHRVEEYRARAERHASHLAAFNGQVERYNLMLSYPDGLDERDQFANRR